MSSPSRSEGLNRFPIQWHVTVDCDQSCKHCYMKDGKFYDQQLKKPLSYEECVEIIDRYKKFTDNWDLSSYIYFTGGDPLLRKDIFDLLEYCKDNQVPTAILGNPYHLNERVVSRLEESGLKKYQLSIDGMEEMHDTLRMEGSFEETLRALDLLKKSSIHTIVMFTISKKNKKDLFDVIDLVRRKGVDTFAFTRLVPTGSGKSLEKDLFNEGEYKGLLLKVLERYRKLESEGTLTNLGRKSCDPWALLERDLGLLKPVERERGYLFLRRCPLGGHLCILADGTVLGCRKLPIKIGKLPEQSFKEILSSEKFKKILKNRCVENSDERARGCAAMPYAVHGDIKKPDPNCW